MTDIDKDFYGFVVNGNGYFKGQSVDLAGIKTNIMAYNEIGVSVSREFENSLWVQGSNTCRASRNANTSKPDSSIHTPQNSFDPINVKCRERSILQVCLFCLTALTAARQQMMKRVWRLLIIIPCKIMDGPLDLGATYWVTPRLNVHASVTDLGFDLLEK